MANSRKASQGITLIELLVVLVILSVALSTVVPSLGKSYETWMLRAAARRTAALFRFASDTARRESTELAGYYDEHRLVLLRNGSVFKGMEIPASIHVRPQKPAGVIFLSSGQMISTEEFVLENENGRRMAIEIGPLPGQVTIKEEKK